MLQGAYDVFTTIAAKMEDAIFAETTSAEVAAAAGVEKDSFVAIKNFEGGSHNAYSGLRGGWPANSA